MRSRYISRAKIVPFPRFNFISNSYFDIEKTLKESNNRHEVLICPFCDKKIQVKSIYINSINHEWKILNKCPHLRGIERNGIAFIKNVNEVKQLEKEYMDQYEKEITEKYKYWIFYD